VSASLKDLHARPVASEGAEKLLTQLFEGEMFCIRNFLFALEEKK
jgi:hypothetical protein